jgi:hypothetical protein
MLEMCWDALRPLLQLSAALIGLEPTAFEAPSTSSRHSIWHSRHWREQILEDRMVLAGI